MARAKKCRKVCHFPQAHAFAPVEIPAKDAVILSVDEYETIRLIDKEGLSQEQCGGQMEISRTTVQLIYASARRKLATALVDGLALRIEGGDYQLCNGETAGQGCCGCFKYQFHQQYAKPKGETTMRIAVTFENGEVFQHFGHTEQFKVYDAADGKVTASKIVSTDGQGHGALVGVLHALKVDALICGGIGGGARTALDAAGIKLYGGVSGNADEAVNHLLAGTLAYDPEVQCRHHDHSHGHHACGHHGHGHEHCQNQETFGCQESTNT